MNSIPQNRPSHNTPIGRLVATIRRAAGPKTPGEIRYRIRFLRATFGDCLNTWPEYAQAEYDQLARRLRRLETGVKTDER